MKWLYLLASLLLLALLGHALSRGHAVLVRERPLLPLNFDHRVHGQVNCLTCHHDYADRSPAGPAAGRTCILCHKQTPGLAVRIEQDFHRLCRGCHVQKVQAFDAAGPVRACRQCHAPPLLALPE
ncbi:Class III cytochrome C family protein [compost metagenome]